MPYVGYTSYIGLLLIEENERIKQVSVSRKDEFISLCEIFSLHLFRKWLFLLSTWVTLPELLLFFFPVFIIFFSIVCLHGTLYSSSGSSHVRDNPTNFAARWFPSNWRTTGEASKDERDSPVSWHIRAASKVNVFYGSFFLSGEKERRGLLPLCLDELTAVWIAMIIDVSLFFIIFLLFFDYFVLKGSCHETWRQILIELSLYQILIRAFETG